MILRKQHNDSVLRPRSPSTELSTTPRARASSGVHSSHCTMMGENCVPSASSTPPLPRSSNCATTLPGLEADKALHCRPRDGRVAKYPARQKLRLSAARRRPWDVVVRKDVGITAGIDPIRKRETRARHEHGVHRHMIVENR